MPFNSAHGLGMTTFGLEENVCVSGVKACPHWSGRLVTFFSLEEAGSEIRFVANCAKPIHCRAWEPETLVIKMVCFPTMEGETPIAI